MNVTMHLIRFYKSVSHLSLLQHNISGLGFIYAAVSVYMKPKPLMSLIMLCLYINLFNKYDHK